MAKYKRRKDGRYQSNVYVGRDPDTGKRVFKALYAKTLQELDDLKSEARDSLNKGTYADDKGMYVKEWAKKWFDLEKANCGIRTKEMYERLVNTYIIPDIGDIRLRDLVKSDIQLMINKHSDHHRTCEQIRMATRQMIDSAIDDGLLYKNVGTKIKLPAKYTQEKRALTDEEKTAIQKTEFSTKEKAFIYIMLYCGLRRGEMLGLSRNDINFAKKEISVRNVVTFDHGAAVLKPCPKTSSGFRNIPIPEELLSILKAYIHELGTIYLFEMERKSGLMSKTSYDKFWSRITSKINASAGGTDDILAIYGLTAHVFRHNYATMLYYAGIDVKDAQRLLGHSNIKITLDIYTHLDESKSDAGSKLKNISVFSG